MRLNDVIDKARELLPEGETVAVERYIAGMVDLGATDSEWRYGLEALLTAGEACYTDDFDVIRRAA